VKTFYHELAHVYIGDFGRNIPKGSHPNADKDIRAVEKEAERNFAGLRGNSNEVNDNDLLGRAVLADNNDCKSTRVMAMRSGAALLRRDGNLFGFQNAELDKHALQRAAPKIRLPCGQTDNYVDIIIGVDGHVKCARALKGHPILKKAAVEASRAWVFSPFESDHQRRVVCGHLLFEIHQ